MDQIQKRFDDAEKVSGQIPIDFRVYRIRLEKQDLQDPEDKAAAVNSHLDVQIEKDFQILQVSFQHQGEREERKMKEMVKDIYRYYGVTEEDKEEE